MKKYKLENYNNDVRCYEDMDIMIQDICEFMDNHTDIKSMFEVPNMSEVIYQPDKIGKYPTTFKISFLNFLDFENKNWKKYPLYSKIISEYGSLVNYFKMHAKT